MSQQRLDELNHRAWTSTLSSLLLQGRTLGKSHRGLNRHRGSASVVFPVEIWLLILENLALRDLYSLTVTSRFFYINFTSIYLNRVAREGIPKQEQPTQAPAITMGTCIVFLLYAISLIEAILAGILIAKSPDLSHTACCIYVAIVCCYSLGIGNVIGVSRPQSWVGRHDIYLWAFGCLLWLASIIIGHVVLANNDCSSNTIESRETDVLYCGLWKPVLAFTWIGSTLSTGLLWLDG